MNKTFALIHILALFVLCSAEAWATDSPAEENVAAAMEEVEVRGQKSRQQLERAVVEARLDFWEIYNSLNTDNDYRIVCEKVAVTGSRFKKRRCVPQYFLTAMSEMTRQQSIRRLPNDELQLRAPPPRESTVRLATKGKKNEADAHMIKLIEDNPVLREKYYALLDANEKLEQSKPSE